MKAGWNITSHVQSLKHGYYPAIRAGSSPGKICFCQVVLWLMTKAGLLREASLTGSFKTCGISQFKKIVMYILKVNDFVKNLGVHLYPKVGKEANLIIRTLGVW